MAHGDGMEGFRACFAEFADLRRGNAQRHELDEIMMIALVATCDCLVIIIIIDTHQK
jgi:hypothetical protein